MADEEKDLKQFGSRLALLLASSNFPDDVKESLAEAIPEMNAEQLDKLSAILERSVSQAAADELLPFRDQVQKVNEDHAKNMKAAQDKALAGLAEIEKQVK